MKIKEIKINNYGILKNKKINFENKLNIIYGKNESGKSTLLNYIKNIFYGISKNKNGKNISEYEKYLPWTEEEFSGKIKYELDNGENFEVFRDFKKKNPKIFNSNFEDISGQFNIDKKDGNKFFYDQTKVDEGMFSSTVLSMQQEVKLSKSDQNVLVQKVANLAASGEDTVSYKRALDRLNRGQLEEVGTERSQEKPINKIRKKLEYTLIDIETIENKKDSLENLQGQIEEIKQEIEKKELKNYAILELHKIKSVNEIEKEKIKVKEEINNEKKEKTGRTMKRNDWCLKDGEYHLTVLGVVGRPDGTFLITKRVMTKAWAPGWWEVSGGAAQAGEESCEAVLREVKEETGLDVRNAEGGYLFTYKRENPGEGDNYFVDVYRFVMDIDESDLHLQTEETDGYMFATVDEIKAFAAEGKFLHYDSIKKAFEM